MPTTLLGTVEVVDTAGALWRLDGQPPAPGPAPLVTPIEPPRNDGNQGPVLAYVDLLPERSDVAFLDLASTTEFAGVVHLRPADERLLDADRAAEIVGETAAAIRDLASAHGTTEVHVLLRCPYALALLIGRSMNTLTVHLYEWEDTAEAGNTGPRYLPSLVLRSGVGGSPIHQVTAPPVEKFPQEP